MVRIMPARGRLVEDELDFDLDFERRRERSAETANRFHARLGR